MNFKAELDKKGLIVIALQDSFLESFEALVFDFSKDHNGLLSLSREDLFKKVVQLQAGFNAANLIPKFCLEHRDLFEELCGTSKISYSASGFLRVVRPRIEKTVRKADDFLGFHREIFYSTSEFIKHQINIHIPIFNYNDLTSMKYVPGSHLIPDDDFLFEAMNEGDNGIMRGSIEHRNGLAYAPKKIISGCDLKSAIPFRLKISEAAIFKSDLIHGGGMNPTNQVRVSVDFAVIPTDVIPDEENYQLAAIDGMKYRTLN